VNEMLNRMTSSEFSEWIAYHELDPFGQEREDLRAGMIAAPLINCWSKKGGKKAKPKDWILKSKKLQTPQDWTFMQKIFKSVVKNYEKKEQQKKNKEKK